MAVHSGSTRSTIQENPRVLLLFFSTKLSETEALATGAVPTWHGARTANGLTTPSRLSWQ